VLIQGDHSIRKADLTFAQAYLQCINRYLFPAGDGHTLVTPQNCTTVGIALVKVCWHVILTLTCLFGGRALRSKCEHDCHCGGDHHDLDSHRPQLPAMRAYPPMPRRVHPPGPDAGAGGLIVIPRPFEGRGIASAVAGTSLTMARCRV
jgi:hypothetical protein